MGDWVTRVGDIVVLTNDVGATCVEATGGKVLASSMFRHAGSSVAQWTPFGGAGRTLYATATTQAGASGELVADVAMPAACGRA